MRFSDEEIRVAKQLRRQGLSWEPMAGHYVYDETGFCKQPSPFQEKVYFILNYGYFMKTVGGVERFKEIMIWLPTWYDTRQILEAWQVSHQEIGEWLREQGALERGQERLALYKLILARTGGYRDA